MHLSPLFALYLIPVAAALAAEPATPAPALDPAPGFLWAIQAGGVGHDKTRGLTTDAAGNAYMTGEFAKTATFGDFTVESKGDLDFFVAKYSPAGKCLWVRTGGGSQIDRGYGVAVDAQGAVFVTGHSQSTDASFDGMTIENRGGYDVFVAKYDADGKLQWIKSGGGSGYDYGHGIGVDKAGNCYVTGAIVGDYEFAGLKGSNTPGGHVFLARFSPAGKLDWLRVAAGTGGSEGENVAVDAAGNSVVVGSAGGTVNFGADFGFQSKGGREPLALKYDANGGIVWVFSGDGSTSGLFSGAAVDDRGQVALAGSFKGKVALGGKVVESQGENDLLVAKLDIQGRLRWWQTGGGPGVDYALGIASDAAGNSFVSGEIQAGATIGKVSVANKGLRDLYLAKFDDDGVLRWLLTAGGSSGCLGYCVARDAAGEFYVSGAFDGTATFGSSTFKSKGSNDVMLLKFGH